MPTQSDIDFLTRLAELRAAQRFGLLPPAGSISDRTLAKNLGMSRTQLAAVKRIALLKVADGLSRRGVPIHDLRAIRSLISRRHD